MSASPKARAEERRIHDGWRIHHRFGMVERTWLPGNQTVGLLPAVPVCRNRIDCPRVSGDNMTDGLARKEIPPRASGALSPLASPNPSYVLGVEIGL